MSACRPEGWSLPWWFFIQVRGDRMEPTEALNSPMPAKVRQRIINLWFGNGNTGVRILQKKLSVLFLNSWIFWSHSVKAITDSSQLDVEEIGCCSQVRIGKGLLLTIICLGWLKGRFVFELSNRPDGTEISARHLHLARIVQLVQAWCRFSGKILPVPLQFSVSNFHNLVRCR